MLGRIWQSIVRFFQGLFGLTPKPQPVPPPPKINRLSDVEYESLFMQLLDGVHQGWSRGQVNGFLMAKRTTEVDLVAWLQGFGSKLLTSPELHLELGQRMVQLGEVGCGKLGEVAAEFGRQLLASVLTTEETQAAEAWFDRGCDEYDAGNYEVAFACFKSAIDDNPNNPQAWEKYGNTLQQLGRISEAIAANNKALHLYRNDNTPKLPPINHVSFNSSKTQEAEAWLDQGCDEGEAGNYEQALACFDKALEFKGDYHAAWCNRIVAVGHSVFCDPLLASMSSIATKNPALNQRGYEGQLTTYQEGLKYCPQDTHLESWGKLHQAIGDAHYSRGRNDSRPRPYWHKAVNIYHKALKTLTKKAFPEAHLEVLQDLIKVYYDLGQREKTEALRLVGSEVLFELLQKTPSNTVKIRLSRKFASFAQLRVDELVRLGNWCAALELAEQHKNLCLSWLRYGWSESVEDSPKYAQMQELLQPSTTGKDGEKAIVYWHISPAAITTFILRHKQPPLILSAKADLTPPAPLPCKGMGEPNTPLLAEEEQGERFNCPPSRHQLIEFEDWMNTWKKGYPNYRQEIGKENEENRLEKKEIPVSYSEQKRWREQMRERLKMLDKILNLQEILLHLKEVNQLILISHRDLHLLPLHALLPDNFTITYLPSIKVGLDLKKAKQNAIPWQFVASLLSVENPTDDLRDASLELKLIRQLYPNSQPLSKSAATPEAVKEALSTGAGVFHFTGHSEHNLNQPDQSALILANKERLTFRNILELDLSRWQLACLGGCVTNFTSKVGLIDEFVGLASAFLAAGVTNVVGSLWYVDDLSTAYLMTKFHEILKNPNNSEPPDVASALKKAQNLLRTVTKKELQQWGAQLPLELSQYRTLRIPVQNMDEEMEENDKPFESPFYWAAFCAIG